VLVLLALFFLAGQAVVAVVVKPMMLVLAVVLVQLMVAVEVAVRLVIQQLLELAVLAVAVVLKFTHGDLYEQICTYKQSKHC